MIRGALLFLVCVLLPSGVFSARAFGQAVTFDTATAASVWAAALSYIAPRALSPVTIPQMTLWGLNGLAALDPDLNTTLQDQQIRLYGPDQLILAVPAPPSDDAKAWAAAGSKIAAAAFAASPALRQAGTQGIISNFFDELFNHFDPYSRYEPPLQAAQQQLLVTGPATTGLTLAAQGHDVVVAAVAVQSPAEAAGVAPGSIVHDVDGHAAYPSEVTHLNAMMDGIPGSTIRFTLTDPDDATPASVTLTRAAVPPQTVLPEPAPVPGVLALKITGFNKGTGDQFSSILAEAMSASKPYDGLLLDLRGNRGGILRQSVLVADSLLPAGLIVRAHGRDPDADQSFSAEGADLTGGLPIVVLVDGTTASAAEILAAALSDNDRAVIVGSETLGKGLVQTVTQLPDGGELYVTWSRVLAPRGWPLQSLGVMPQICTSLGPEALRTQLDALLKGRNELAPILAQARNFDPAASADPDKVLAIRDHCPADLGGLLDLTAADFLFAHPAAYRAALLPPVSRPF